MKTKNALGCLNAGGAKAGFSLVESLAVMAILTVMMAMMAPAMRSFSDTAGRRGAVNTLMNTLEQARVAALESGREVTVLLVRQAMPDEDRMLVVRQSESGNGYEQLSKWIKLPKGVLFFRPASGGSVLPGSDENDLPTGFSLELIPVKIPASPSGSGIATIQFNASGQVAHPANNLILHISEGVRAANGNQMRVNEARTGLPFEIITLSKYTGRAQLDVTELAAN